jgi:hypothetical protein
MLSAVAGFAACDRHPDSSVTAPSSQKVTPAAGAISFIAVSSANPVVGSTVVVTGNATGADAAHGIASFRARLQYDTAGLQYMGDVTSSGMMHALNPQPGEIIVAGASSSPMADSKMFALRFLVRRDQGVRTLVLLMDELNDAAYRDQMSALKPQTEQRVDASLAHLSRSPAK